MTYNGPNREEPRGWWIALFRAIAALCIGFSGGILFLWIRAFADSKWQVLLLLSLAGFLVSWPMIISEVRRLTQNSAQEEIPPSTALGPVGKLAVGCFLLGIVSFVVFLSINYGRWGDS
jgi:hypothetical protein